MLSSKQTGLIEALEIDVNNAAVCTQKCGKILEKTTHLQILVSVLFATPLPKNGY